MRNFGFILLSLLLLFCSCQNTPERLRRRHISELENMIKADSTRGEEFKSFFAQFVKDSLFQHERITIPFVKHLTDNGYETGCIRDSVVTINNKNEWTFCSFMMNNSVNYPFQSIKIDHDTALVHLFDNQSEDYSRNKIHSLFVRVKGKWMITALDIIH